MKKLKYYGGQGFEYSNENGKFEVKANKTKQFTKLSEAKKYYESLNEEKAIWDTTTIPELLECYIF
jgi:hypothetical protein